VARGNGGICETIKIWRRRDKKGRIDRSARPRIFLKGAYRLLST